MQIEETSARDIASHFHTPGEFVPFAFLYM
jgi:hypothetical protein